MYMYNSMRTFAIFLAFRESEKEIDSQSEGHGLTQFSFTTQ